MSHAVADVFGVQNRGYVREGYIADLLLVDQDVQHLLQSENHLYKCGWSPLERYEFASRI